MYIWEVANVTESAVVHADNPKATYTPQHFQ